MRIANGLCHIPEFFCELLSLLSSLSLTRPFLSHSKHICVHLFLFLPPVLSIDIQSTFNRPSQLNTSTAFRTGHRNKEQASKRITSDTPHTTRHGIQSHRQSGRWQEAAGQNHAHHDSSPNRQQCLREAGLCRATILWPQVIVLPPAPLLHEHFCKLHAHPVIFRGYSTYCLFVIKLDAN